MTTQVLVEEASLDDGVAMVFKDYGRRVRIAIDPSRTTEAAALGMLVLHLPHLDGAMEVTHRIGA